MISRRQRLNRDIIDARPRLSYSIVPTCVTITVLAALLPWLVQLKSPAVTVLLCCFVAQCAHGAARSIMSGYQLLTSVFWAFSACYLAIPAVYQVSHNAAAWGDSFIYQDEPRLTYTLITLNLGYAMFAIGAAGTLAAPMAPRFSGLISSQAKPPGLGQLSPRIKTAAFCSSLALLLLPLVAQRSGGIGGLLSSRTERTQFLATSGIAQTTSGGVAVALVEILPGALALAATFGYLTWWRAGARRAPLILLIPTMGLLFLYTNPLTNTRYISTVAIFSLIFVLLQPRTRRALVVIVLLIVVGVVGIYPLANAFRGGESQAESLSLADNDFDGFQQLVNTRQYVEQRGHTWGKQIGSALLFFLPRSYWPGKAVPASIPVAQNRGYRFTNLSLPLPGELYLEFGLVGSAGLMFGWGRLWRQLDRAWRVGPVTKKAAMVPYLVIAQLGLLRGPVGSLVPIYGSTVLLLIVLLRRNNTEPGSVEPRDLSANGIHAGLEQPADRGSTPKLVGRAPRTPEFD